MIECEKPLTAGTEESHQLEIAIYVSASSELNEELAPILAKRFKTQHENHAYVRTLSVTPDRGDVNGGTPVIVEAQFNSLLIDSEE